MRYSAFVVVGEVVEFFFFFRELGWFEMLGVVSRLKISGGLEKAGEYFWGGV